MIGAGLGGARTKAPNCAAFHHVFCVRPCRHRPIIRTRRRAPVFQRCGATADGASRGRRQRPREDRRPLVTQAGTGARGRPGPAIAGAVDLPRHHDRCGDLAVARGWMAGRVSGLFRDGFAFDRRAAFDENVMLDMLERMLGGALLTLMPLFVALMVAAVAAPMVLGGLGLRTQGARLSSTASTRCRGWGACSRCTGWSDVPGHPEVRTGRRRGRPGAVVRVRAPVQPDGRAPRDRHGGFSATIVFATLLVVLSLGLLAAIDVPFQLWQYHEAAHDEGRGRSARARRQEGDPMIKGRIRAMQREMARVA